MERNFFRRVELAFPVFDPQQRERILQDLETYLNDNTNAWELLADGSYRRLHSTRSRKSCDAQELLLERYAGVPTVEA
jgi:polyphosphate kinase